MSNSNTFEKLRSADISGLTKDKGKFKYLSWSNAVREATKICPDLSWEHTKFGEFGLPYLQTPVGFFVECSVTIAGVTKTQMMPVLNHTNRTEQNPDAALINKTQMRALTKAIALHGLGLDLWAGEDINEYDTSTGENLPTYINEDQIKQLSELILNEDGTLNELGAKVHKAFNFPNMESITVKKFPQILKACK